MASIFHKSKSKRNINFFHISIRLLFIPTIALLLYYFLNIGLQIRIAILIHQENLRQRIQCTSNDMERNETKVTYQISSTRSNGKNHRISPASSSTSVSSECILISRIFFFRKKSKILFSNFVFTNFS